MNRRRSKEAHRASVARNRAKRRQVLAERRSGKRKAPKGLPSMPRVQHVRTPAGKVITPKSWVSWALRKAG